VLNFHIFIGSVVKICKQCLQLTALASEGPADPTGALPLEPTGDFGPQTS